MMGGYDDFNCNVWDTLKQDRAGNVNYIQFHTRVNIWLTASASGLLNPTVAS